MSTDLAEKKKSFYITTTLPYVNAEPHIGFAMELIRADIIARFKKSQGFEVFFNTGTDEHGQKLFDTAKKAGRDVKEYVDQYALSFKKLVPLLGISEDIHFIRTTDKHHEKAAQEFWKRVYDAGYIYKKNYTAKYCVGCEENKTESELADGHCLIHPNLEIQILDEENYFFKFSEFGSRLLELYDRTEKEGRSFVVPDFRLNEMREFVKRGLEDFSISRLKSKMSWGVPVPNDEDHVMYVWFDALVNYISTLGWPDDMSQFERFWTEGTPVQYCGKDNTRFQSVMWQAMLMAAGLPNSHTIVVNGFITSGGQKMSKSLGNVINPKYIIEGYGHDTLRFFVSKELSSFEDSDFTEDRLKASYNADLANGVGNLTSRIMKLSQSYVSEQFAFEDDSWVAPDYREQLESYNIQRACQIVWHYIADLDKQIQEGKPFLLIKTDLEAGKKMIQEHVHSLWRISNMLQPILPETSEKIRLCIRENKTPETPLFARKD